MKALLAATLVAVVAVALAGDCPKCPPEWSWPVVELRWARFVKHPTQEAAGAFLAVFPGDDVIVIPPDQRALSDGIGERLDLVLPAVGARESWAFQMALRFLHIRGFPHTPELQSALGQLATITPEFFLRQLVIYREQNPCTVGFFDVVQYFGTPEEIRKGTDSKAEDLAARVRALSSVEDPGLREVRDACVGLLSVAETRAQDTAFPRVLRRVKPDLSAFDAKGAAVPIIIVEAVIGRDGKVKKVEVRRGGNKEIEQIVSKALMQWEFEAWREGERPPEVFFTLVVRPEYY